MRKVGGWSATLQLQAMMNLPITARPSCGARSEPHAQPGDHRQLVGIIAGVARKFGRPPELAFPMQPHVWRKLATKLVTQTQTQFQVRKSRADAVLRVVLAERTKLQLGLQDEPLRDQKVVLARESC